MRLELKVYVSHTDAQRIHFAAKKMGVSVSAFMRIAALACVTSLRVPELSEELEGQQVFEAMLETVGGSN